MIAIGIDIGGMSIKGAAVMVEYMKSSLCLLLKANQEKKQFVN